MIPYSRPKLSDFYTLFESKLAGNHTLHSVMYLYSSYMGVPHPPGIKKLKLLEQAALTTISTTYVLIWNFYNQMNTKNAKKTKCHSKESLSRRRKQREQKKKEKVREAASTGKCQEGGVPHKDVESVTAKNVELNMQLEEEIKRRKVLQNENLDFCKKLEKIQKTNGKLSENTGEVLQRGTIPP